MCNMAFITALNQILNLALLANVILTFKVRKYNRKLSQVKKLYCFFSNTFFLASDPAIRFYLKKVLILSWVLWYDNSLYCNFPLHQPFSA